VSGIFTRGIDPRPSNTLVPCRRAVGRDKWTGGDVRTAFVLGLGLGFCAGVVTLLLAIR